MIKFNKNVFNSYKLYLANQKLFDLLFSPFSSIMHPTTRNTALDTAQRILTNGHQHEAKLQSVLPLFYPSMAVEDNSNNEHKFKAPVLKTIYMAEGQQGQLTLMNFASGKFNKFWSKLKDHISGHWNVGVGRKFSQKPKNIFLMVLIVLKGENCGT